MPHREQMISQLNPEFRLLDGMAGQMVQGIADRYWTEHTGVRAADDGMTTFWMNKHLRVMMNYLMIYLHRLKSQVLQLTNLQQIHSIQLHELVRIEEERQLFFFYGVAWNNTS